MNRDEIIESHIDTVVRKITFIKPGFRFGEDNLIEWTESIRGRRAGTCWPSLNRIGIHPALPEEHLEDTVAHEICHILASQIGGSGHDRVWKNCMRAIGYAPDRVLNLSTDIIPKVRQERIWEYTCNCDESHKILTRTHNKIMRGRRYRCNVCKEYLTLKRIGEGR